MIAIDGHQRLVPDLIEYCHRPATCVGRAQLGFPSTKCAGGRYCDQFSTGKLAKLFNRSRNVIKPTQLVIKYRDPELQKPLDLALRVSVQPNYDQVGFERNNSLQIELRTISDARNALRRRWIIGVSDCTNHALAGTGSKQQLGDMRRKTDDPPRRLRERYASAAIIVETDLSGMCGTGKRHRGGERKSESQCPHAVPVSNAAAAAGFEGK